MILCGVSSKGVPNDYKGCRMIDQLRAVTKSSAIFSIVHFENDPSCDIFLYLFLPPNTCIRWCHHYDLDILVSLLATPWKPFLSLQCKLVNFYLICKWSWTHTNILIVAEGKGTTVTQNSASLLHSAIFLAHDNSVSGRNLFIVGGTENWAVIFLRPVRGALLASSIVIITYCQQSAVFNSKQAISLYGSVHALCC